MSAGIDGGARAVTVAGPEPGPASVALPGDGARGQGRANGGDAPAAAIATAHTADTTGTATMTGALAACPPAPRPRIALLTGRSDPRSGALSPVQRATLAALAGHAARTGSADAIDIDIEPLNFPWHADADARAPWRPVPLARASVANARQYLAARRGALHGLSPADADAARERLLAPPRTLLLVGSCGLALLEALVAPLDTAQRARVRAVAWGAVAPRWPAGVAGTQLRGDRDRIAAWLGPRDGPPPRTLAAGHMDYLDAGPARDAVLAGAREHLPWLRGAA